MFGPATLSAVKSFQRSNGLYADGIVGKLTAGVVSFQAQNGLYADGIVGKLTWSKLGCSTTTPTTPTPPTVPTTPTTPPTVPTTPTTPAPSATAAQIIAYAKTFQGVPYVWGGSTPSGFDCSGFVSYVFKQYGITMPRVSAQQQAYFPSTTNPQPGDLLFYGYPAYHVAIYLGDGMMIDAPHP
ncbi:MAG: cell wall lytic activity, partial [Dermacoccus nishinomiyaensis]